MIITPSERRRAERLEALVSGRAQADETDEAAYRLAARLQSLDVGGGIDPAFRDRLRQRLVAVATVQGNAAEPDARPARGERHLHRPPRRRMPRRLAIAGGTLAALVALSGVGAASGDAVPGDALYSVKRSREAAQLALARSDVSRGQLHLQFARTRLAEAATVLGNDRQLRRVLGDMDADTRTGMRELTGAAVERRDRAPLDFIEQEFVAMQRRQLIALIGDLPENRRGRALDSLALIEQAHERSRALRPSLQCAAGHAGASRSDELGPLPRRCAALPGVEPGGSAVPGGPDTATENPRTTVPRNSLSATPGAPSTAGLPRVPTGPPDPGLSTSPPATEPSSPTPTPSGGTQGVLGSVTGTVGGVVGGLLGGLSG